jgi:hypothetical protein
MMFSNPAYAVRQQLETFSPTFGISLTRSDRECHIHVRAGAN